MSVIQYAFDPTGSSPDNLVQGEQHGVSESQYRDYSFIVPDFAPFFADGLVITYNDGNETRELIEGLDYYPALPFQGAIRSIGKPIYGAVTLNNLNVNGIVSFRYQTLGMPWVADKQYVLERLAEKVYNPRLVIWDLVTNVQQVFPPINHDQNSDTIFGQKELIQSITDIGDKIVSSRDQLGIVKHLTNLNNPHNVSADQVGLGEVVNLPLATDIDIQAVNPVDKYMTLKQVIALLQVYGIQPPVQ